MMFFPVTICEDCAKAGKHCGNNSDCIGCDRTPKPKPQPPDPRVFDPAKTLGVILGPGGMVQHRLTTWLSQLGIPKVECQETFFRNYEDAYNGYVIDFALAKRNRRFQQFIFADADMRPNLRQTNRFLDLLDGDVRCVEYKTQVGPQISWGHETAFHTGIWWTTRNVLESIDPPWFEFRKTANGCKTKGCICQSLREQLLDAGYTIRHGGYAGHTPRISRCQAIGTNENDLI